jgi:hypothetical protein
VPRHGTLKVRRFRTERLPALYPLVCEGTKKEAPPVRFEAASLNRAGGALSLPDDGGQMMSNFPSSCFPMAVCQVKKRKRAVASGGPRPDRRRLAAPSLDLRRTKSSTYRRAIPSDVESGQTEDL